MNFDSSNVSRDLMLALVRIVMKLLRTISPSCTRHRHTDIELLSRRSDYFSDSFASPIEADCSCSGAPIGAWTPPENKKPQHH